MCDAHLSRRHTVKLWHRVKDGKLAPRCPSFLAFLYFLFGEASATV